MIEKLNSMHNVTALLNAIFCIAWHEKAYLSEESSAVVHRRGFD